MGVDPVEREWGDLKPAREHSVVKKVLRTEVVDVDSQGAQGPAIRGAAAGIGYLDMAQGSVDCAGGGPRISRGNTSHAEHPSGSLYFVSRGFGRSVSPDKHISQLYTCDGCFARSVSPVDGVRGRNEDV